MSLFRARTADIGKNWKFQTPRRLVTSSISSIRALGRSCPTTQPFSQRRKRNRRSPEIRTNVTNWWTVQVMRHNYWKIPAMLGLSFKSLQILRSKLKRQEDADENTMKNRTALYINQNGEAVTRHNS